MSAERALLRKILQEGYCDWAYGGTGDEPDKTTLVTDNRVSVTPQEQALIEAIWTEEDTSET